MKVGGVKSLAPVLNSLANLKEYFGGKQIAAIRHSDLVAFKKHRLDTPTIHKAQRKVSSVNRELELARAMFRYAMQERWITISPFIGTPITFDSPRDYTKKPNYTQKGQLHELTHVWQIHNRSFVAGWICEGLVTQGLDSLGKKVYSYGAAGQAWNGFNIEQQASIVDDWFGGTRFDPPKPMDKNDSYYRYIRDNIMTGRP